MLVVEWVLHDALLVGLLVGRADHLASDLLLALPGPVGPGRENAQYLSVYLDGDGPRGLRERGRGAVHVLADIFGHDIGIAALP